MRKKICKWFYDHGKYGIAYRISPSYTVQLFAEDIQSAMIKGIKEARKEAERKKNE